MGTKPTALESLRYTSAPSRREAILKRLKATGYVSAAALSAEFAVSEMTIRRDLTKLAEQELIKLVHGGASLPPGAQLGVAFPDRARERADEKRAIGQWAVNWANPQSTIGIDAGTTTSELAMALPSDRELTVITHSLPAMEILAEREGITLIGLGGFFHQSTRSFSGPDTRAAIKNLRVHTLFLAATGLGDNGVYCSTPFDAETKRALIEIADTVVLLVDSSKFRHTAPVFVCPFTDIDVVVTDPAVEHESPVLSGFEGQLEFAAPRASA